MKRRLNKLFAAFLAVMLLVSCTSLAAFADETTIYKAPDGHSYELYQIFTGDYSNETLVNIKWGLNGLKPTSHADHTKDNKNIDYTSSGVTAVCDFVLDDLKGVSGEDVSDSTKLNTIKKYVDLTSTPYKSATKEGDQPVKAAADGNALVYNDVPAGYYLIKDLDGTQDNGGVYTLYVVKTSNGKILFEPKGKAPTIEKKVLAEDGVSWVTNNAASMGENVKFQITATVNSRITDYGQYYFKMTDTLSKGLITTDDTCNVKVTMTTQETLYDTDGKTVTGYKNHSYDVTDYFYAKVGTTSTDDGTTPFVVGIQDLLALRYATGIKETDGTAATSVLVNGTTKIVVEYTAKLTKDAVVVDPNNNDVYLDYYNDPNTSGEGNPTPPGKNPPDEPTPGKGIPTGETEKSTTHTYTATLNITKEDDNGNVLKGAEFTLTGTNVYEGMKVTSKIEFQEAADGTYWKLKSGLYTTVDPSGTIEVNGEKKAVDTSTYESTETKYKKVVTEDVAAVTSGTNVQSIKGTVSDDGLLTFTGLGPGTYTLTESKTPAGYNTMNPITFEISFDNTNKVFKSDRGDVTVSTDGKTLNATILNHAGSTLPHTGGIGTTIFYVVGTILVLSAGVLLITKKRMGREQN
jgi:fimbrial isopeptide formation D2 family protein/LPXTG-motif cell wall-anchored protein